MKWPNAKYGVIYADPGWAYNNAKTGAAMLSGSADQYTVMSPEDIMALPVRDLLLPNAIMFLWTTTPMKEVGMKVLKAWGFQYKTTIYWHKVGKNGKPGRLGMGFWTRGQVEELLLGIHGKVPPFRSSERNCLDLPATRHSEKPEQFRQLIERLTVAYKPKLELFARRRTSGWDAYGDQL